MEKLTMKYFATAVVLLSVQLSAGIPYGNHHHFIESPKLSRWGDWGKLEHCPSDQVVVGMRLKVHNNQGVKDDTGLNAVKFYCQNPYSSVEYAGDVVEITSLVGNEGEWKQNYFCPSVSITSSSHGVGATDGSESKLLAVGFQLRSETSSGVKDDTAGNNLRLVCSDLYQKQGYTNLEGDGTQRGHWTDRQLCWPGYAICALQTQVEVSRSIDTTGLNNLKVRCCKVDGGNTNLGETGSRNGTIMVHGSVESSLESSENSSTREIGKDTHNQGHRGDHANSGEDSGTAAEEGGNGGRESHESREGLPEDEQELVAFVDPEPVVEEDTLDALKITHDATVPLSNNQSSSVEVERSSSQNGEDENLPEEIARIDQVDNSEANREEEEGDDSGNVSTQTDTLNHPLISIPEEMVNALEDVDSSNIDENDSTSGGGHDHEHPHGHGDTRPFHWGTEVTNLTNILENDVDNSLEEEEPKSSPRFGQNGTTTGSTSSSAVSSKLSTNFKALGIGSMLMVYFAKII